MNCLIDHIGLKGCGQDDAPSGYYINDLLSDALQQTSKLTTSEKATFTEIWEDIQKRAVRRFGVDVTNFLSKKYRLKRVAQSINLGTKINTTTDQTAPANDNRGLIIDLNPNDTCGESSMQVIHIQYLSIYVKVASGVPMSVRIIDADTLETLQTITITAVVGWNKLAEELNFNATRIGIVYIGDTITSPAFELPEACSCCAYELGCDTICHGCCDASIKGVITDNEGVSTYGTNTYGISGIFSVNCSYEGFVCDNKNLFTYPLWQLLGYMLMDERIYSSRLNQFTLVNIDGAKERRDKFLDEYNRSMLDVLDGLDLCGDCCLECNEQITNQEVHL